MLRLYSLLVLIVLISVMRPIAASPADADFDHEFGRILEEAGVPGGSYAIVRNGRIVHAAGYGVRANGNDLPVTADTVFRVASVSKTFAAQLTAMLVSEGLISWEDGVTRYVPEFRLKHPDHARQLQIRHLLGQSTGIVPNAYDNLLNASLSLDQIVPRFGELEPMCRPGECYTYQNVLFSLVSPVIEHTTRRSYDELLRERLFEPLGMKHASTGLAGYLAADNRALPHVRRGRVWFATDVNENYYRVLPAAGVNASALDLGQWLVAQMGHWPEVVRPELAAEVTEKRVRTARDLRRRGWRDILTDAHYGLGWRIYTVGEEEIYMHSGWVQGFVAQIGYSRDRQTGLAVLLNAESSVLNEITSQFWKQTLSTPPMLNRLEVSRPGSEGGNPAGPAAVIGQD